MRWSGPELAEESRWDKYLLNTPQEGEETGEDPEDTVYLSRSHLHGKGNARSVLATIHQRAICLLTRFPLNGALR